MRLLDLVEAGLRDLESALGLLRSPLPLLRTLASLDKALPRRLRKLVVVRDLGLVVLDTSLECSVFALEHLAAVADAPELLELLLVRLTGHVGERLDLLCSLAELVPTILL